MKRNLRKGKSKQIQKTLSPFTVCSPKMAEKETESTPESSISLQTLREELQASREAVLGQLKAEITTLFNDIKANISSLRKETKADIRAIHEELASEQACLRSAHAETISNVKEMGNTLSETMDRVTALEQSQQAIARAATISRHYRQRRQ